MRPRPLAALLLLAASAARPAEGPASLFAGPPGQEILLEADSLTYDLDTRAIALEGHVVVRRGEGVLRAARGRLDRAHDTLALSGGVLAVQGREVFLADGAVVDLASRSAELTNAVVYLKERPASADNPTAGRNALTLHGQRVRKLASGALEAQDIRLTPCDCKGEPDYEIVAKRALIEGDRAHLSGARLRLGGLPVPLFPLSLPLTARQSGLLAPQLGFASVGGFGIAQPIFVTLGRSFDLTLTPGLFTGTAHGGDPAIGRRTVAGPRLGLEGRYAPSDGTRGQLTLDLLYDLWQGASPFVDARFPGEAPSRKGRGLSGLRGVAHFTHRTDGTAGAFAVKGTAATDTMILADAEPLVLESALDVLRTDAGAWRSRGPLTVGADATLLEDVRVADSARPDRRLFGSERRATFQRVPALFAQLAPSAVGPLALSSEASIVAMAPLGRRDAQEIATGFGPTDRQAGPSQLSGADFGRAPMLRVDLAPRIAASLPREVPVDVQLELGARADAWVLPGFEARNRQRVYGFAGARASVDLERQYGSVLHVVTPQLQLRAISRELSGGGPPIGDPADAGGSLYSPYPQAAEQGLAPGLPRRGSTSVTEGVPASRRAYDEIDFAAPSTGEGEATLGVSQSLWVRRGTVTRILRLDLLQDVLLWSSGAGSRVGETSAVASLQLGPVSASALARYDWRLRALSVVSGNFGVHDDRGDEAHGTLLLLRGSSERLRAGIDELFSAVRLATPAGAASGGTSVGGSAALPLARNGLRVGYDLSRVLGALPPNAPDLRHSLTLVYETPCRCAGVSFTAELPFRGGTFLRTPVFHFVLDLKSLGGFATF